MAPATTVGAATFPGIWPFATQTEADAYAAGPDRTFRDPSATAREFAARYVGMASPVAFVPVVVGEVTDVPVGFGRGEGGAPISGPRPSMTVSLRRTGDGPTAPWTVVGARSAEITVDQPKSLSRISSPVKLAGTAIAFEGNVTVAVREDGMLSDQSLGRGSVTGGGTEKIPFDGEVEFRTPTKPAGAVVLYELSAADGQSVLRATVVRVSFT
ncbi:MAG: Gmad2 immunoglobulin-like domain-containing protein [Acidimicrobiales bacterium]